MTHNSLVRPLFDGPIDIVADIHGEIEALRQLLSSLGYSETGVHAEGRRLVFLGDYTDRGPDSPAVVALVRQLVEAGPAQAILGNHDLNLLLGKRRHGNAWFYGQKESLDKSGELVPQRLADEETRTEVVEFFRQLPLLLSRPDLRVVHAYWHGPSVEVARQASDAVQLHDHSKAAIEETLKRRSDADDADAELARQNDNPVKALTSGLERRVKEPFYAGGNMRYQERARWWADYTDQPFCVFGHYWRTPIPGGGTGEDLFAGIPPHATLGNGQSMCIDYSVGARWKERLNPGFDGTFKVRLAALRWPKRALVFDDGETAAVERP